MSGIMNCTMNGIEMCGSDVMSCHVMSCYVNRSIAT